MERAEARRAAFEELARVGKVLASPRRLELLDLLGQGERSVEELARGTDMNLTTASAHLQSLRRARLVTVRRDGTRLYYRLAGREVGDLYVQLQRAAVARLPELRLALDALLADDVDAVDRDELWQLLRAGTVTVVDVRPRAEYAAGHLPGALSVPFEELADRLAELPADREVVAYCRGPLCVLSHDAVALLRDRGRRARRLPDGVLEWQAADLPVEGAGAA